MALIDVEIEKLVYGGEGLTRVDGRTGLIPFVLPGEKLRAEIFHDTPRLFRARPVEFESQSEERVAARCPLFTNCGGCHYQHIPYEAQLAFKKQILLETLARIGKVEWGGEVASVSGEPWGYRNRTQLRILKRGRQAEVGFLAPGSHRVVPATDCPINSPKLNQVHSRLRELAQERRFPDFLHEIEFFTNETDVQLNVVSTERPLSGKFFQWCAREIEGMLPGEYIEYPSGEDVFRVGSRSFFQVNRFLTNDLAQAATAIGTGETALDLYAGVGLLTVPMARRFGKVTAVDSSGAAVRSLQFNAERAGVQARVVHSNVDRFLEDFNETVDFVVADPPRAGLGKTVTAELLRIGPGQISLVSCDPSTLARDLRALLDGGYKIESLTLIDLFPQTFHMETVVRLAK